MSKQANSTLIGLFVLGGCALIVGAILIFGSGNIYKERHLFVMYFNGSVNGLNVGSPVNMRGVQVGTVNSISLINDTSKGEIHIPVIAEFYPGKIVTVGEPAGVTKENIDRLVKEFGLRAQLQIQSILTGQLFVQLDYQPGTEYEYYGDGELIEVPIIPSTMELLEKQFGGFDFSVVANDISSAVSAISRLADAPGLEQAVANLDSALLATNDLVNNVNAKVDPLFNKTSRLLDGLHDSLATVDQATKNIKDLSDEESPTVYRLNLAIDELTSAAKSIRTLADSLERHPEALIHGRKPGR